MFITDDDGFRILTYNAPVALPDGGSWTATLTDWDRWRAFTVTFDVHVRRADGGTETLAFVLTEPGDWSLEPGATRDRIDGGVRDHLGLPW